MNDIDTVMQGIGTQAKAAAAQLAYAQDLQKTLALEAAAKSVWDCLLYTSPSPRDGLLSRMPSSA